MKNKIRLAIGWFGVLTPVYAAGILTMLFVIDYIHMQFIAGVVLVSILNFMIGWNIIRLKLPEKEENKHGCTATRG